jgi:hypothetical protein
MVCPLNFDRWHDMEMSCRLPLQPLLAAGKYLQHLLVAIWSRCGCGTEWENPICSSLRHMMCPLTHILSLSSTVNFGVFHLHLFTNSESPVSCFVI